MLSEILSQLRKHRSTLLVVSIFLLIVLSTLVIVQNRWGVRVSDLMRDVTAVARVVPWTGAVSSLGMVIWSAAAALCFFGGAMARRLRRSNWLSLFLYCSGGVTVLLLLDDLFQIHENAPDLFGFSEDLFLALYVVVIGGYLLTFRRQILQTDYALFILALGIFGLSIIVDVIPAMELLREVYDGLDYLLEDGAKLTGITLWLAYFAHTAAWVVQPDAE